MHTKTSHLKNPRCIKRRVLFKITITRVSPWIVLKDDINFTKNIYAGTVIAKLYGYHGNEENKIGKWNVSVSTFAKRNIRGCYTCTQHGNYFSQ